MRGNATHVEWHIWRPFKMALAAEFPNGWTELVSATKCRAKAQEDRLTITAHGNKVINFVGQLPSPPSNLKSHMEKEFLKAKGEQMKNQDKIVMFFYKI